MSGRVARIARSVAAAGGLVLLLALVVWGLERGGAVNAWLTTRIAALLGPQVRFSAARAVWWPRLAVMLDQVALVPAEPAPTAGIASATAVTCQVRLAPLLRGRVEIATVQVEGLHLAVERASDGAVHAGGLETLAAQAAREPSAAPLPALPAVRVHGGELAYREAGPPARTLQLRAVDLQLIASGAGARGELTAAVGGGGTLRVRGTLDSLTDSAAAQYHADVEADALEAATVLAWLPPAVVDRTTAQGHLRLTANVSGHGTAAAAGDASIELSDGSIARAAWQGDAPLHMTAHAVWDGSALTVSRGQVDLARLSGAALSADTLAASFAYGNGALRIDAAQWRACGGTWRAAGSATLGDPPHIDASVQADEIDATQMAACLSAVGVAAALPQLSAPLRLSAQASGEPGGRWSGHAAIATDGVVASPGARLEGPLEIAADVQAEGAAVELSNGSARARRVAAGPLVLDAVTSRFTYARGVARVAPLRATAFGGTWTYSGTLPPDTAGAWSGQLAGTRVSAAALRHAFSGAGTAGGTIDMSAQLTGTGTSAITGSATARLASPALTWDDLRVESPAAVSAALRVQGTRVALSNGQAQARRLVLREIHTAAISTGFSYADSTVQVAGARARAFGGRWRADASVALTTPPSWTGTVDAHQIDFDALLHAVAGPHGEPRSAGALADLSVHAARGSDASPRATVAITLGRGEFIWDDLHVGAPAHATGTVVVHGETFSLSQVSAEAARTTYGPVIATAAAANFQYGGSRLSFDDLRFTSCGGTWTHHGWFTLAEGGQFAGQISIEGAVPHDLALMLHNPGVDVPFARFDLDSDFAGRATPDWLSNLRASGSLLVSDGNVKAATVLKPIWEALIGPGRVMDAMDRVTTHVEQISGSYTLHHDRMQCTDLSMISDDYSVTAIGSVGLDGTLDLNSRIRLSAQGVQQMLVFAFVPLPTSTLPSLPSIPARVTGTFANPLVRPNVSALPAATVRWMVSVLLHGPRTIGGAVLDGLGNLWSRISGSPRSDQ